MRLRTCGVGSRVRNKAVHTCSHNQHAAALPYQQCSRPRSAPGLLPSAACTPQPLEHSPSACAQERTAVTRSTGPHISTYCQALAAYGTVCAAAYSTVVGWRLAGGVLDKRIPHQAHAGELPMQAETASPCAHTAAAAPHVRLCCPLI